MSKDTDVVEHPLDGESKQSGQFVHVSQAEFLPLTEKELIDEFGADSHRRGKKFSKIMNSAAREALRAGQQIHEEYEASCKLGRGSEYGKRIAKWLAYYGGIDRKTADRYRKAWVKLRIFIEEDDNKFLEYWNQFRLSALYELSRNDVPNEIREAAVEIAKSGNVTINTELVQKLLQALTSNSNTESADNPTASAQISADATKNASDEDAPVFDTESPVVITTPNDVLLSATPAPSGILGPDIRDSLQALIKKYFKARCLVVDPPYRYSNSSSNGSAQDHYSTMSMEELIKLPIPEIADENSHLFLWVPTPLLPKGLKLLAAWGWTYKSCFVWVKNRGEKLGLGNYWRIDTEYLLLGVKGTLTFLSDSERNWVLCPPGRHSEKPSDIRDLIELVSPGPRIELFARGEAPAGWTFIGNEVSNTQIPELPNLTSTK